MINKSRMCGGRRYDGRLCGYYMTPDGVCTKCGFIAPPDWQGPSDDDLADLWKIERERTED